MSEDGSVRVDSRAFLTRAITCFDEGIVLGHATARDVMAEGFFSVSEGCTRRLLSTLCHSISLIFFSVLAVHLVPSDIYEMVVVVELNEGLACVTTDTAAVYELTTAVVVWNLDDNTLARLDFNKPNNCLC